MEIDALRRFEPLYWNARWNCASDTLRRYLSLPPDYPIPLALPHGVDFGHIEPAQDLLAVEPIHWAHNSEIAEAVAPLKPVLAIPHPFLLALWNLPPMPRAGTLVIGPPPGIDNDRTLAAMLDPADAAETTILVKPKPGFEQSKAFWREQGYSVATLADDGPSSYETMAALLARSERVIGCTFSSLVIFAAASGATVGLLKGYRYDCYDLIETGTRYEVVNWESRHAASVVRRFMEGSREEVLDLALELLGNRLDRDPQVLRERLAQAIADLDEPVYWRLRHTLPIRWAATEIACALRRPGVLRINPSRWLRRRFRPRVWARKLDEIGLWLHGRNRDTIEERKVAYRKGQTEPGDAVVQYPWT